LVQGSSSLVCALNHASKHRPAKKTAVLDSLALAVSGGVTC